MLCALGSVVTPECENGFVNVSKHEQRTLHALAQGGKIVVEKDDKGRIVEIACLTREGWCLTDCTMPVFGKLRSRRLIASMNGQPYRITRDGLAAVRAQLDNR
jgi:uncharacterized protein